MDPNITLDITSRLNRLSVQRPNEDNQLPEIFRPDSPCTWGYARVSTKKQRDDGHSLPAQVEKIKLYLVQKGLSQPVHIFRDEGISGKTMKPRPDFMKLRRVIKRGDTIVATSLSRIGRNVCEILDFANELKTLGIDLITTDLQIDTTTAAGRALFGMLAVMAEMERDLASERTAAVLKQRKETGHATSRPPFGTQADPATKKLAPNPDEQLVIDYIAKWIHDEPGIRDCEIVKRLQTRFEAGEIKMRRASKVHQSTISNIIKRYNLRAQPVAPP